MEARRNSPNLDAYAATSPVFERLAAGVIPFPELLSGESIIGAGTDICMTDAMGKALADPSDMFSALFAPEEISYCSQFEVDGLQRFTAHFAAKEAVVKALRGIPGGYFNEIIVVHNEDGSPRIRLEGKAWERADSLGVKRVAVSLAHEPEAALAFVIAVK